MSDIDKIKRLRQSTGAGFKDCNSAIHEANGDLDKSSNFTYLTYKSYFRNTAFVEFTNFHRTSSKDFWVTRKDPTAPFIRRPENYGTNIQFSGPSRNFFNYRWKNCCSLSRRS